MNPSESMPVQLRMTGTELLQPLAEQVAPEIGAGGNAHLPTHLPLAGQQFSPGILKRLQRHTAVLHVQMPFVGQAKAAGGPVEQFGL